MPMWVQDLVDLEQTVEEGELVKEENSEYDD
jgi:hypothetical protein